MSKNDTKKIDELAENMSAALEILNQSISRISAAFNSAAREMVNFWDDLPDEIKKTLLQQETERIAGQMLSINSDMIIEHLNQLIISIVNQNAEISIFDEHTLDNRDELELVIVYKLKDSE